MSTTARIIAFGPQVRMRAASTVAMASVTRPRTPRDPSSVVSVSLQPVAAMSSRSTRILAGARAIEQVIGAVAIFLREPQKRRQPDAAGDEQIDARRLRRGERLAERTEQRHRRAFERELQKARAAADRLDQDLAAAVAQAQDREGARQQRIAPPLASQHHELSGKRLGERGAVVGQRQSQHEIPARQRAILDDARRHIHGWPA